MQYSFDDEFAAILSTAVSICGVFTLLVAHLLFGGVLLRTPDIK